MKKGRISSHFLFIPDGKVMKIDWYLNQEIIMTKAQSLKKAFANFQVRETGEQLSLTFRKQCSFSRHWSLLHFPTILLGYKAALSVVYRGETEAGSVPQRLSQSITWHCPQKKQPWAPFPSHNFPQAQAVISASSLGWHVSLCSHRVDWSRGLIQFLRAIPSHAGVTLWWNTIIDILVPKFMLHWRFQGCSHKLRLFWNSFYPSRQ